MAHSTYSIMRGAIAAPSLRVRRADAGSGSWTTTSSTPALILCTQRRFGAFAIRPAGNFQPNRISVRPIALSAAFFEVATVMSASTSAARSSAPYRSASQASGLKMRIGVGIRVFSIASLRKAQTLNDAVQHLCRFFDLLDQHVFVDGMRLGEPAGAEHQAARIAGHGLHHRG